MDADVIAEPVVICGVHSIANAYHEFNKLMHEYAERLELFNVDADLEQCEDCLHNAINKSINVSILNAEPKCSSDFQQHFNVVANAYSKRNVKYIYFHESVANSELDAGSIVVAVADLDFITVSNAISGAIAHTLSQSFAISELHTILVAGAECLADTDS